MQTLGLAGNDEDWFTNITYTEEMFAQNHGPGFLREEAEERWPDRVSYTANIMTDSLHLQGIRHHQHNQMFNLHCQLLYHNVPHLFFNAHIGFYDDVAKEKRDCDFNPPTSVPLPSYDWCNRFWNVYDREDSSFVSWAQRRGYELTDGFHVPNPGAVEFAHVLHDYIIEHGLLER